MRELDDEMHTRFADLRAEDEAHAPEFSVLWNEAKRHAPAIHSRRQIRGAWWVLIAASVVTAAALIARGEHGSAEAPRMPDDATYPSLTSWQSPTDGLLHDSRPLVASPASSLGSVLDGVTAPGTDISKGGGQ